MEYAGKTIPKLGFGFMRLPMSGKEVDIEQTKEMVDLFMTKGFTYFDTAYVYMDGKSEEAIREALVKRYPRESFQTATKLPAWAASSKEETRQMFYTSLERMGVEYFDFYLLHNCGGPRTESFDKYEVWDFLKEQKQKGLIKKLGFSLHDKAEVLDEILNKHPDMDFVQLQINYADWESPSVESRKCYETACRHNMPVVIMEPVKGGSLLNVPDSIKDILKEADPDASLASWAIRYAASLDNIVTVLSGMSNIEQMKDNLSYMEDFKPLNESEREVIKRVQKALDEIPIIPCTNCQYCVKGCPNEVKIPQIFNSLNLNTVFNNLESAKRNYFFETNKGGKASECIGCRECEQVCPQHIEISEILKEAAGMLE